MIGKSPWLEDGKAVILQRNQLKRSYDEKTYDSHSGNPTRSAHAGSV
jgi:hypothetical protein